MITQGRLAARLSMRSLNSRSMRSRVAPKTSCWNAARSSSRKKAWHLRQPCRRVFAKRLKQGRSIGSAAQFVQSLDQRQEGLVGSEKFAATTVQRAHAPLLHPLHRHLDERRLAYPGLAGDENNLTAPRLDLLQHAFQDLQRNGPPDPPDVGADRPCPRKRKLPPRVGFSTLEDRIAVTDAMNRYPRRVTVSM